MTLDCALPVARGLLPRCLSNAGMPFLLLLLVLGCRSGGREAARHRQALVPPLTQTEAPWQRTELFFGLTRRNGSVISARQWNRFLDDHITPRFPAGLTAVSAEGRYVDPERHLHREPSRVVILLYPPSSASEVRRNIRLVVEEYIALFDQESVLESDSGETVTFYEREHENPAPSTGPAPVMNDD